MSDLSTKPAKEEELDLIFAEEFSCDPNFTLQYFREAFPAIGNVKIEDVAIQPKLHDGGYGDLLVLAKANGKSHALLIEHKISAGPAPEQAERYRNHATHLRSEGRSVVTALVAPRAYVGETKKYDLRLNLEDVIKFMANPEEARLAYRKARVMRAIEKKNATGVQVPDERVLKLRRKYYQTAERFCASSQIPLSFPLLKLEYYDGDAWIWPIHPDLPNGVELRHRLWTSKVKHEEGQVDLIVREPDENQKSRFESKNSDRYKYSAFSPESSKPGVQLSVTLPALKLHAEYSGEVVERACSTMAELVAWYTGD